MSKDLPDRQPLDRIRELQKKRGEILKLPPEQALDAILSDPQPAAVVHSFPESDFYFLTHDIGPEDALPLLALASDKQWDYLVDLESWSKDRFEVNGVTRWLNLLMEADPRRFVQWSLKDRLEFIELYLFHNIEVRIREHDQDPSEFGEGFFTLDQIYYVRFLNLPQSLEGSAIGEEERRQFLMKLLERLAANDHLTYQSLLLEASHTIPAEAEEEEYRWRNIRLAEQGFLPFDEAIGIYQPVTPQKLRSLTPKFIPRSPDAAGPSLPVPVYPIKEMSADTHFSRALARVEADQVLQHLQWEFANLCNQIIVADRKTIREREPLREVVAKACGYISIGLERLKEETAPTADPAKAATELIRYPLVGLFRLGFGSALQIKWQAESWLGSSWAAKAGLRLSFWGEQWMGVLGGILLKKPLFYDNYQRGVLYREFESLEDVERTATVLRQIQAVDHLLAAMDFRLKASDHYHFLTWKNLLLTLWASRRLGLQAESLNPLALNPFIRFFNELLPGDPPAGHAELRRIPGALKSDFLAWLSQNTGIQDYEISEKLGRVFEELFAEIESEYGRVAAKDLDPRFVHLFLLKSA